MNEAIKDMFGKTVMVDWNRGEEMQFTEAILEAYDYPFIRLLLHDHYHMCLPVHAIFSIRLKPTE